MGLTRLTVAATSVAGSAAAAVKPSIAEAHARYTRGELAESAAALATGGLSSLKGSTYSQMRCLQCSLTPYVHQ